MESTEVRLQGSQQGHHQQHIHVNRGAKRRLHADAYYLNLLLLSLASCLAFGYVSYGIRLMDARLMLVIYLLWNFFPLWIYEC